MRQQEDLRTPPEGATWIAARARNALRRTALLTLLAALTFAASLTAFLGISRVRAPRAAPPAQVQRPDTAAIVRTLSDARDEARRADSALSRVRSVAQRPPPPPPPVDTLSPEQIARRDSLTAAAAALTRQIQRVEGAPLPASYRALGELPVMTNEARVRALLDTLGQIERDREAFGAAGGIDPIFVELTARANAVGRAIQAVAEERRTAMRNEIAALRPPPPPPVVAAPVIDTLPYRARYDSAAVQVAGLESALGRARGVHAELDRLEELAQPRFDLAAPPVALVIAAVILGLAISFAIALAVESRRPRVADAREVERLTGIRVLATIRPHAAPPERARRRADREAPPLLTPSSDAYRMLYLHLAPASGVIPAVAFLGESSAITAVVGANAAAMAAYDARSTLLVDADLDQGNVAGMLRIPRDPGLAEVLDGTIGWVDATAPVSVGRDRVLYVLPAGSPRHGAVPNEWRLAIREQVERLTRRYDAVFVTGTLGRSDKGPLPPPPADDVVLCAQVGRTGLRRLLQGIARLRDEGVRVRGIVLWEMDEPAIEDPLPHDRIGATG